MIWKLSRKILFAVFIFIFSRSGEAANINGKVTIHSGWQPILFMASVNSPEDINVTSPDFNISQTLINPDGTFTFQNITLPPDLRFYRFYMLKDRNSFIELSSPNDRFFTHLLLNDSSNITFNAVTDSLEFRIESVSGETNQRLLYFQNNFYDKKKRFNGDISKAQKEFLSINLENYIRQFVDTCSNPLVGLFALYQIEDKETDFLRNSDFYFSFQKKLEHQFPSSVYTEKYDSLLNDLVGFRKMVCEIPGVIPKWKDRLLIVETIVLFVFLLTIIFLWVKQKKLEKNQKIKYLPEKENLKKLTTKEREILELLSLGRSNKEIASELFIELSTVKSHLGRIYKQLNVTGRQEAIRYFNRLK